MKNRRYVVIRDDFIIQCQELETHYQECTESSTPFPSTHLISLHSCYISQRRMGLHVTLSWLTRLWKAGAKCSCLACHEDVRQTWSMHKIPLVSEHNCSCFFSCLSKILENKNEWKRGLYKRRSRELVSNQSKQLQLCTWHLPSPGKLQLRAVANIRIH